MTINEMQAEIIRLKKETNTAILVHSYQSREIVEIADYVGDSYKLSVDAKGIDADTLLLAIVFGVDIETAIVRCEVFVSVMEWSNIGTDAGTVPF